MNHSLPELVDPWRMVSARRTFAGRLPLAAMKRLAGGLADSVGEIEYELDFDKDQAGVSGVRVRASTALPLICQRTLERFEYPVEIDARLGFIVNEEDEAALPAGYEPLLLDPAGLHPADVIEDELILALPVFPVKPGTQEMQHEWKEANEVEAAKPNPFAALKNVKL
ncbi:MAG: YceD family protein [Rudaea sp.]|uniref:YceD family protein n=1 Tax=Rudaea sp. TaxID=2136325 RepID=UPI0039E3854F